MCLRDTICSVKALVLLGIIDRGPFCPGEDWFQIPLFNLPNIDLPPATSALICWTPSQETHVIASPLERLLVPNKPFLHRPASPKPKLRLPPTAACLLTTVQCPCHRCLEYRCWPDHVTRSSQHHDIRRPLPACIPGVPSRDQNDQDSASEPKQFFHYSVPKYIATAFFTVFPAPRSGMGTAKGTLVIDLSAGLRCLSRTIPCVGFEINMET